MEKTKFTHCKYESCAYMKQCDDPTYLLLYVDILIAFKDMVHIKKIKSQLQKEFHMNNLETRKILGMKNSRDRILVKLWLSQDNYIFKVLKRFNMDEARPVTTTLAGHFKFSSRQCPQSPEDKEISQVTYASAV